MLAVLFVACLAFSVVLVVIMCSFGQSRDWL